MDDNKPDMKEIKAEKYNHEWIMDTKGFFLIDPKPEENIIYAHHYNKDKSYNLTISGKTAEEIYYTIIRKELVDNLIHAAYIGSELQKAELVIKHKIEKYVQDKPLSLLDI